MLIGAHVSPAGGLPKAIERGLERGCTAIQIFNQSPRMWRPSAYRDEDVAAFREAMAASPIGAVLIHAVYLLNCASDDPDIRVKTLASLTHSLRVGHAIGATGVVLHPGSAKTGHVGAAIASAGATIGEDLRVRSLHLNDSQTPLGSNRDRHANLGDGELGEEGCAAFLSAPGIQRLPCVLETPGETRQGANAEEVARARELRERGLAARRGPAGGRG